jgi:hypothetical protein
MSQITPVLGLTYLEGINPRSYVLRITLEGQSNSNHLLSNHSGSYTTPNLEYLANVNMTQSSEGLVNRMIDLGQLNIHPQDGDINVILMDGATQIGSGTIRVKEAEQQSRPVIFNN